jgi:hypothetical protein
LNSYPINSRVVCDIVGLFNGCRDFIEDGSPLIDTIVLRRESGCKTANRAS